jgi:protease-4
MHRSFGGLWIAALVPLLGLPAARAGEDKGKDEKKADTGAKTIVVFRLKHTLQESPIEDPFSLSAAKPTTLKDLVAKMKKAEKDDAVKAVVLLHEGGGIGAAQVEELRQAIASLRAAGKDVCAHADSLTMREYLLLSGASKLSVVPTGDLMVTGLYSESPYLRGLLDLLGAKPDFLTCGSYKSAAEIFMRTGPSPEAERMQNWLLDSLYDTQVNLIARGRGVDAAKAKTWIDGGPYSAEKAKAAGLIDAVEHRQDFEAKLKTKYGKNVVFNKNYGEKKPPKLDFGDPFSLLKSISKMLAAATEAPSTKKAIGVVYVDGPITIGGGSLSLFEDREARAVELRRALDKAANDDSIKAVVLRVDSPGGSAVASEIILDATRRVKARKPFVVSMGNVAGSGGYYVACAADTIFADASTITGSIGVVSGKLATNDMFKKVGITFKSYQRGANAGMLASADVFTRAERERMQAYMDEIYDVFKGHVTAIRGKKLKKPIDDLAGGRVYTGKQALELGLVDKLGTLEDAIAFVAREAKLTDYDVRVVPRPKDFVEKLLEELSGDKEEEGKGLDSLSLPSARPSASLLDLAMPHIKHLDPQRLAAIKQALWRLELIRQEGAVLMMPEFILGR